MLGVGAVRLLGALAHALLHLLGEPLRAAPQALQGAPLRVDGLALAAAAERALGFAHRAVGIVEALLAVHAELLHAPLQLVEAVAQRLLALGEALAGIAATVEPPASVERPHALVELGSAYRETGRLADAARVLDEAIALLGPAPEGAFRSGLAVQARIDRAYVAQDEGRYGEAEAMLDAARVTLEATAAGDRAAGWVAMLGARAEVRVAAGDPEGAVAAAREAVERASREVRVARSRANAAMR